MNHITSSDMCDHVHIICALLFIIGRVTKCVEINKTSFSKLQVSFEYLFAGPSVLVLRYQNGVTPSYGTSFEFRKLLFGLCLSPLTLRLTLTSSLN